MDLVAEARRNWGERGWREIDAMAAATSITRVHQIVLGRINTALTPLGLTFSRYEALALLGFTRTGSLPLSRMGERLQVHPTSVTSTIDRLERDGLVERVPHETDRRTTLARITAAGRQRLDEATAILEAERFGMGELRTEEIANITTSTAPVRASAGDDVTHSLPATTTRSR